MSGLSRQFSSYFFPLRFQVAQKKCEKIRKRKKRKNHRIRETKKRNHKDLLRGSFFESSQKSSWHALIIHNSLGPFQRETAAVEEGKKGSLNLFLFIFMRNAPRRRPPVDVKCHLVWNNIWNALWTCEGMKVKQRQLL